ncbi:hypothetical protein RSAG8_02298, partial [Rhizoctonia solani AG-8 WAC10335]
MSRASGIGLKYLLSVNFTGAFMFGCNLKRFRSGAIQSTLVPCSLVPCSFLISLAHLW